MSKKKILKLVELAVLTALILLMSFPPMSNFFGYLKFGVVEITFITIPVIIGAIILGPAAGAFLGGVFGLSSFLQGVLGLSAFGAALIQFNPIFTFITCFFTRVLMGFLCGLIFKAIKKIDKTGFASFTVASLSGALLNTILFVGTLILLFGRSDYILSMMNNMGAKSIFAFIIAFVGINGLIEAIVCAILGTAISKALSVANKRLK